MHFTTDHLKKMLPSYLSSALSLTQGSYTAALSSTLPLYGTAAKTSAIVISIIVQAAPLRQYWFP